jgi:DNA-binding MarR family transcriptional regulator
MADHKQQESASAPAAVLPPAGAAFLLAQLGAHAAGRFADRVARLDLSPAQTGLLRLVAQGPGRSQQALADQLGVAPSMIVALVDSLEAAGLLERRRSTSDRRNYALHLTPRGTRTLGEIREIAMSHENDLTAALTPDEHRQLTDLLQRVADQQGLTPGVHPGYRKLPKNTADRPRPRRTTKSSPTEGL